MSSSATTAAAQQQQSVRLGGFGEENGGVLNSHLPPRVVFGPDENGVKKVIEYRFDEEGNMERVLTIISPVPEFEREKSAVALKEKKRAGSQLPVLSITGTLPSGSNMEIPLADWTSKCSVCTKASADKSARRGDRKGLYSPFIRPRYDKIRDDPQRIKYDDRTVRVSNLSQDTTEPALFKIFKGFGYVANIYIQVDSKDESGKCVGFVKYAQRREAEYAIRVLNAAIPFNKFEFQVGLAAP